MSRRRIETPIMLADTSGLIDLINMEAANDQASPMSGADNPLSVPKILDQLCGDGKRTLIMPSTVLKELFRTSFGQLTLATDETGKATFPLGAHPTMFRHPNMQALYQYFSQLAQEGKLRCYNSQSDMINAKELDDTKGGIVFVDMQKDRTLDGHLYSHDNHTGKADNLLQLATTIDNYTRAIGLPIQFMILNSNGSVLRDFAKSPMDTQTTSFTRPNVLIDSMVELGKLDQQASIDSRLAMQELATHNEIWARRQQLINDPHGQRILSQDIKNTKSWITATEPKAPAPGRE